MIYTITLNPSIDHYIFTENEIIQGGTNRADRSADICGGKGINVSIVCGMLGIKTVCCGFYGGFTGEELLRQIDLYGIDRRFVKTKAETRINTKIVCLGKVTEINAKAQCVNDDEIKKLIGLLSKIGKGDTVVLSGSVPDTPALLPSVLEAVKNTGARFIADTSGAALKKCIEYKPYMIKPNREELAAYFEVDPENIDIPAYAEKLTGYGIKNVLVSDGETGAYLANENGYRFIPVKDVGLTAKNTTGAGDSMIAGYLYGERNGIDPFLCAVCAGSAAAYSERLFEKNIFDTVINSYKTV